MNLFLFNIHEICNILAILLFHNENILIDFICTAYYADNIPITICRNYGNELHDFNGFIGSNIVLRNGNLDFYR